MTTARVSILTLIVGSTRPFDIEIVDENNAEFSMAGITRASFRIATSLSATDDVLTLDTDEGDLAIGTGKLTGSMTQAQADALETGIFVAEAALLIGSGWQHTDVFHVHVRPAVAEHLS